MTARCSAKLLANAAHALEAEQVVETQTAIVSVLGALNAKVFPRRLDQRLLRNDTAKQRAHTFDELEDLFLRALIACELEVHRAD